jgi:hypothetical protein
MGQPLERLIRGGNQKAPELALIALRGIALAGLGVVGRRWSA